MNDRGVSTVLSYALALGILAILVSGLVVSFAPFVTNQQQDTAQSALVVYGNDLAGDLDTVDRLALEADGNENATVSYRTELPDRVSGSRYHVEIEEVDATEGTYDYEIWLRPVDFEASTFVNVRTRTPIADETLDESFEAGSLLIEYDAGERELVIRDA